MKLSPFLPALAALALVPVALAGGLPRNTAVRVEISGIDGWHEGRITSTIEGCTMVALNKSAQGYNRVALIALLHLERKIGTSYTDVPLKNLLAEEPRQCLEEGAD